MSKLNQDELIQFVKDSIVEPLEWNKFKEISICDLKEAMDYWVTYENNR